MWYSPRYRAVLEIARDGRNCVVLRGIFFVDSHSGRGVLLIEPIHVSRESGGLRIIADGIKSGVRPKLLQEPRIGVAQSTEMKLLGPTLRRVKPAKEQHHKCAKLRLFRWRNRMARSRFLENRGGGLLGAKIRMALVQTVIGQAEGLG